MKWLLYSQNKLDVFLSHDWPQGIHKFGNKAELLRKKKYFATQGTISTQQDVMSITTESKNIEIPKREIKPQVQYSKNSLVKLNMVKKPKKNQDIQNIFSKKNRKK